MAFRFCYCANNSVDVDDCWYPINKYCRKEANKYRGAREILGLTNRQNESKDLSRRYPMRSWAVETKDGRIDRIDSHFMFNNGGEGIIFRAYPPGKDKTIITAMYAAGAWVSLREITIGAQ